MADHVCTGAVFGPVAFFPVVEGEDRAAVFEDAGAVAMHVNLVEAVEEAEAGLRVAGDAFPEFVVAKVHFGVVAAVGVVRFDCFDERNGEEDTPAAHRDEAVHDDCVPFFGVGTEIERFAGVMLG